MKREQLIKILENHEVSIETKGFYGTEGGYGVQDCDYSKVADAILALPLDVPGVSNWVAIKDALPNYNEEVLTITADGWYRIITYGNTGRRFPSQVTHWMRLPKPPCC